MFWGCFGVFPLALAAKTRVVWSWLTLALTTPSCLDSFAVKKAKEKGVRVRNVIRIKDNNPETLQ